MSFYTGGSSAMVGLRQRFREFLTSGVFTPSAALIAAGGVIEIDLRGGGGAGGGSTATIPGGGGGESRTVKMLMLSSVDAIDITIGVGGVPGAVGGFSGGDGGASSFGALLTVPGGKGGRYYQVGGDGGGTNGRCGGTGLVLPTLNMGGDGGGDGGGKGFSYPNAPVAGEPGCGGGGAGYTTTVEAGAPGGGGYALITWWE